CFSADDARGNDGLSFTLGARLAPWRRANRIPAQHDESQIERWEVHQDRDAGHVLHLEAPEARRVELEGDVTDWHVVSLEREGSDSWRVRVEGAPGPHQVLVRLDQGPWVLLPGAPTQEDGYRGLVSVLIFE